MGAGSGEVVDLLLLSFDALVTTSCLVALLSEVDEGGGNGVGFGERGSFCQSDEWFR